MTFGHVVPRNMPTVNQFKKILVIPGYVSDASFETAKKISDENGTTIEDSLVESDLISDEQLGQLVANYLGFPFINLRNEHIDKGAHELVPEIMARAKGIVAFGFEKNALKLGMTDPRDKETIISVEKRAGMPVTPHYITRRDFNESLTRYQEPLEIQYSKIQAELEDIHLTSEKRDHLVVELTDLLINQGYRNHASDIHIEPFTTKLIVRFRIDGIMHTVLQLPKSMHDTIISRVKVLSRLRTDEHRSAQDGKFQFLAEKENVDVRVSVVPVTNGENVVLRLLSAKNRRFSLHDLGLSDEGLELVQKAMMHPHGMLLVTGPTGSGKTTTVYAMLKILNKPEVHIASIEDPVEYDMEGVTQIQVNTKTNLTFASGLRAIVRQDPDIIFVGEIRDPETADIAVNSAMTGHLVLSTIHANDAATTLPRLLDMGIEPFLVATTVRIVAAQRLVRKICVHCRQSYDISTEELTHLESDGRIRESFERSGKNVNQHLILFKGKGCAVCAGTGYQGRVGIFELLELSESIRQLVVKRAPSNEIIKVARQEGMKTMLDDGIEKVLGGVTTLEEVLRVIRE